MSTRKPPDYPLIKRIMEECKKYGSPGELARQLSLNKNLEERNQELQQLNDSLTRTRDSILQRIKELEEQEAAANKRRDDALVESKTLDKEVNAKRKELDDLQTTLAQRLNTKNKWETIQQTMDAELEKLRRAINSCKIILAPAYWLRSILEERRPVLFYQEKEYVINYLTKNQPSQPYNDEIGSQIIDFIISELRSRGTLVPTQSYDLVEKEARRSADKIRGLEQAIHEFTHTPEKMTIEQRRALLIPVAELDSKEKFNELLKQAAEIGVQCPIHHAKTAWHRERLKWICPTPNCTFAI